VVVSIAVLRKTSSRGIGRHGGLWIMPIPAAPEPPVTPSSAVLALFRQVHGELRALVHSCDDASLNFVPCPGANSIATIVTHMAGSEAETMLSLVGRSVPRDRESEFEHGHQSGEEVLRQVDAADQLLDDVAKELTSHRLEAILPLPSLPMTEARPGITWLVGNLGHAREHVGHAFLTKQLYDAAHERSTQGPA
jgi:hypothetical protein